MSLTPLEVLGWVQSHAPEAQFNPSDDESYDDEIVWFSNKRKFGIQIGPNCQYLGVDEYANVPEDDHENFWMRHGGEVNPVALPKPKIKSLLLALIRKAEARDAVVA